MGHPSSPQPGFHPSERAPGKLRIAFRRTSEGLRKPSSRWLRIPLGFGLIVAGLLGFLPVLGFWMIPLGLSLLAVDFPVVRRLLRRLLPAPQDGRN